MNEKGCTYIVSFCLIAVLYMYNGDEQIIISSLHQKEKELRNITGTTYTMELIFSHVHS